MSQASAVDAYSMRTYGSHTSFLVWNDPQYARRPSLRDIQQELNTDLSFTLDIAHLPDPKYLALTSASYDGVRLLLTEPVDVTWREKARDIMLLGFENRDFQNTALGQFLPTSRPYKLARMVGAEDSSYLTTSSLDAEVLLQERANSYGVPLNRVELAEAHRTLKWNYLVSDDPDLYKLREPYFNNRQQHLIRSDDLLPTIARLERRHGRYYPRPRQIYNKGLYYRHALLNAVPHYDTAWATAVFGTHDPRGGLAMELYNFVESFGDRVMSILQMRDELELLLEEAPNNDTEWEVVNKLNYFFVLVTGLFDNLVWLAAIRYGLYTQFNARGRSRDVVVKVSTKNGLPNPNSFQCEIAVNNRLFYDHMLNHQDLIAIFYPIRDSIQHRLVLSGCILEYLDRGWLGVMVYFHPDSLTALQKLAPSIAMDFNSWGLFQAQDTYLVEPRAFTRTAVEQILLFADTALGLLNIPEMLASKPDLQAIIQQPPPAVADLIAGR